MSENFKLPGCNCEFRSIRDFFLNSTIGPSRPIIEGFIIKAFQDGVLAKENVFEIEFSKDYFEYVGFSYDDGVVEVLFMNYFTKRTPKMHFLSTHKDKLRHPKLFEFSFNESLGAISDSLLSFFKGKILNLLTLFCYPFSIEVSQDAKPIFTFDSGETIPTKKTFYIPEGSGILRLKKTYLGDERVTKITAIKNLGRPISGDLDIDCSYCERLILMYEKGNKEIVLEFKNEK